ncbi:MAG TPA: MBL fold metallo-hydrolase [Candidatus Acidoferrales bacterium]|nr:MBL fold metallo-hydrolase [Candidatus Acidoferrales bacterium]
MKLGSIELHILNDGAYRLDGGAMFGVVPKPMWERVAPADERNRITMSMNALLIRAAAQRILVETGAGDKWTDKRRDIYGFGGTRLLPQLADHGIEPDDIDIVINTHLHFDHCGWNTRIVNGVAVPTFPNATYFVHRGELEHARNPNERDRSTYIPDNFEPMARSGQWQLVQGEHFEVVPGVELIVLPGHTRDMMGVRISSGGQTAMFLSDLVPTTAHLPYAWVMGYDSYPLTTLENKKKWLPLVAREGWLALFCHDAKMPAARLREEEDKIVAEPVVVD